MKKSLFPLFLALMSLLPVRTGFPATPEKTKTLLDQYPKTEIPKNAIHTSCPEMFVLDSCFLYDWSVNDSSWIPQRGVYFKYRPDGLLCEDETKYAEGDTWAETSRTLYFYDSRDQPVRELFFSFNPSTFAWDTVTQYLRDYSEKGSLLETLIQKYDGGIWEDEDLYTYKYNDTGHRILLQRSYKAPSDTGWIPSYRNLYSWEETLNTGYIKQNYDTASGNWINSYKEEYGYDQNSQMSVKNLYKWDSSTEVWINESQIFFSYDENRRLILKRYQSWRTDHWEDVARYLYTYGQPDTTRILFQVWYSSDDSWRDTYRFVYTFDVCGNLSCETGQSWENASSQWVNDYRVINHISPFYPGNLLQAEIVESGNISCHGQSDGWALARAAGGTPPYTWLWDNDPPSTDSLATGLKAWRWYHVTVTDAAGNTAVDSVMLSEPEPLITGTIYGAQDVCLERKYCYHVSPPQDGYYLWSALGGEILGYPVGPQAAVRWTRPGTDTLAVVFVNRQGCMGDTALLVVSSFTVSIRSSQAGSVTVWPNPATEVLHVSFPGKENFFYSITTLSGQRLLSGRSEDVTETLISVSSLPPGIYLLELISRGERSVRKIVIR